MKYDGCSGFMSWFWRTFLGKPPPWEGCCDEHDAVYAWGGTKQRRWLADNRLYWCVRYNGHPTWARIMWLAVRIGGHPLLPLPWRWGFKYSWPRGYDR